MSSPIELEAPTRGGLAASCVGTANGDLNTPIVHVIEQKAEQPAGNPRAWNRVRDHTKIRRVCRLFVDHDGAAERAIAQKTKGILGRVERRVFAPRPLHHRCVMSSQKLHHVSEEPARLGQNNEAVDLKGQFRRIDAPKGFAP